MHSELDIGFETSATVVSWGAFVMRLSFLDIARGYAVLCMLVWHSADAWLSHTYRDSSPTAMAWLRFIGGSAAPLFIFLAGASAVLKWHSDADKGKSITQSLHGSIARGAELIVLGYLLRWQMWVVDGGALLLPGGLITLGFAALAFTGLLLSLRPSTPKHKVLRRLTRHKSSVIVISSLFAIVALGRVWIYVPHRWPMVMRFDVLQVIGASLVLLALWMAVTQRLSVTTNAILLVLLAMVWSAMTLPMARALPERLPHALMAWIVRPETGERWRFMALFPIFPWFAHALMGAAWACGWIRWKPPSAQAKKPGIGWMPITFICALWVYPWTSEIFLSPAFHPGFAIAHQLPDSVPLLRVLNRSAVNVGWLGLAYLTQTIAWARPSLMAAGQASLWIYWIHLEITFGVISLSIHHRLPLISWLTASSVLIISSIALGKAIQSWEKRRLSFGRKVEKKS